MILLLNGSINAGKTTIGKSISNRKINFAHIEGDALRNFIRWMPLEETIKLNIKNAITIAKNFDEHNIHSVISYPLTADNLDYIKELLKGTSIELHTVALYPGIDKLKTNRGTRELTDEEINRIDVLHEMKITNPDFCTVIDNSTQTVEETTNSVLQAIGIKT